MTIQADAATRPSTTLRNVGLVTAAVGPLTGGLLTLVALVIAGNLLMRRQRHAAVAVALVAVAAMAVFLLFVTPVSSVSPFFRG